MTPLKTTYEANETFGRYVCLSNGAVTLKAALDFGPRIMHFSCEGSANMLYNDPSKSPLNKSLAENDHKTISLCGGHRLWLSPEMMPRTYYPDHVPVACTENVDGITLTAPIEEFIHVQKSIRIVMDEKNTNVTLTHSVTNKGGWDITFAPWAITVMATGGVSFIPVPQKETGYLPNKNLVFWPYAKLNDERFFLGKNFISIKQDKNKKTPFKMGLNNENGYAAYFNLGQVFIKQSNYIMDASYPDFGCSYETYTNDVMLEMETLGELVTLAPECSCQHEEKWYISQCTDLPSNDNELQAILERSF